MSLAACLLGYGFAVAVFGPGLLVRATRNGSAPRMGILAWMVAVATVLGTWVAAAVLTVAELVLARGDLGRVLVACVAALRSAATGGHGPIVQAGLIILGVAAGAGVVVSTARVGRALARFRRHTHRHAAAARMVGCSVHESGVVVLDVPHRLVYAVAGRPSAIVVSRPVLDVLDARQLDAVLAHERAHLAGRHHLLVALTRAAAAVPRVRLFTSAAAEVARLIELCADDAAGRRHGRRDLVDALLALATSPPVPDGAFPRGALAAAGAGLVDRVERLLAPPDPGRVRAARLRLGLCSAGLLAGPLVVTALAVVRSGLCDTLLF